MEEKNKLLVVIDMQNDFIDGSLANPMAQAIVDKVADYIKNYDGKVLFTQDTHYSNYLKTKEGKNLPIEHCIVDTHGWLINDRVYKAVLGKQHKIVKKEQFMLDDPECVYKLLYNYYEHIDQIDICGVCTDICVISNALMLAGDFSQENTRIIVHSDLCAGTTKENHESALAVMRSCQIEVV